MAAVSTLAAVAGGALVSALTRKHGQSAMPQVPTMPSAPDPAILAAQKEQAAQRAAAFARLRSASQPMNGVQGSMTGPAGIPTPAPVARASLIGQ